MYVMISFSIITQVIIEILALSLAENGVIFSKMHFSAFCKLAEKYFLVGMNSLGTLREYIGNGCMQIHPLGVLWRRLTFIFHE